MEFTQKNRENGSKEKQHQFSKQLKVGVMYLHGEQCTYIGNQDIKTEEGAIRNLGSSLHAYGKWAWCSSAYILLSLQQACLKFPDNQFKVLFNAKALTFW